MVLWGGSMIKDIKDDIALIKKALDGHSKAFDILYNRYYNQVYAYCSRLLRGKHEVDDAVQQVFLEAWRSMGRFEGRSLFSTWLTKIAIHTCLSFHRKSGKIILVTQDSDRSYEQVNRSLWGDTKSTPDQQVFNNERKAIINKLLKRMTNKKKVVFMMSDMQGMTAPEISSILKIPDATVRTRLFHARKEFAGWINKNRNYKDLLMLD